MAQESRQVDRSFKTRDWCWTLNNPTESERSTLGGLVDVPRGIQFLIFQEERGENGTLHFQGYLECATTHNINWLKNNFNSRAHFEPRRGSQKQAIDYCKKDDTYVEGGLRIQVGEPHGLAAAELRQRCCDDLDEIRAGKKRLTECDSKVLMQSGFFHAAVHFTGTTLGPNRQQKMQIITIIGASGIGKSWAAYAIGGDAIITYKRNGFFAGAQSEGDVLLFDEFTGNLPLADFLGYTDGFPNHLPVKGSHYPARYTKVFITSNVMPEHWWSKKDDEINLKREGELECLYRRIGYPGPNNEYPGFDNGCFIVVPRQDEHGHPYTKQEQRRYLHQRLFMLGFDMFEPPHEEESSDED